MNRLKGVILIESIIISALAFFLIFNNPISHVIIEQQVSYCDKHFYDSQICLLSPIVYTGILQSQNFLVLNFKPLQADIQNYITNNKLNISVYVLNMRDSSSFGIDATKGFEPASLNKLPVAILILKKVENRKLSLDSVLSITDEDRDSRSGTLYDNLIGEMKVKDLLYYMLSESDNTAFRVLEEQLTLEDLQNLSVYLNYYTKDIDYTPPYNNSYQITAKSTSNLFLSLYLSTILKPDDSELILKFLTNTSFDINKYAGLPNEILISHKYGSYYVGEESFFHDCGIMYIEDSRIFYCVMTKNLSEQKAPEAIGTIVNKIYNYVIEKRKITSLNA